MLYLPNSCGEVMQVTVEKCCWQPISPLH